jgi:hypothetical protein
MKGQILANIRFPGYVPHESTVTRLNKSQRGQQRDQHVDGDGTACWVSRQPGPPPVRFSMEYYDAAEVALLRERRLGRGWINYHRL